MNGNNSHKEDGFTLIETVVSLSIISACVFFFSLAVTQIRSVHSSVKDDRQMEWHMYINQLEHDLKDTVIERVNPNRLEYKKVNAASGKLETVSHSTYTNMVRRQIDARGHQPMLMEVKTYQLEWEGNRLKLSVLFENGERFTAYLKAERG